MVCSNCGQELNDSVKFCTKCGTKFNTGLASNNQLLSYLPIIFSAIGIIGIIIITNIFNKGRIQSIGILRLFPIFLILIVIGIITTIITQYKHKNKFSFITGLIPCVYLIVILLPIIFPFLRFLNFLGNFNFLVYLAYFR